MTFRRLSLARLVLVIFLSATGAAAESAVTRNQTVGTTSGSIAGRITDASGAAIAGATVTASGASLMGIRVVMSTADGSYQFAALPPGDYVVLFEYAGFQRASSEGIRVGAVFTATVDAVLHVAHVAERVTVEPRSGVVDIHSTAIATRFDATQLANLPGARSMFAILSSTPGIQVARFDVGGNSGEAGGQYRAYGTGGQNRPMLEGISVAGIFPIGFTIDYGAFEEVTVGLGAHGPEWPLPGVQMQFIAKSGGNRYRGTLYGDVERRDWQAHNIDADQQRRAAAAGATLSPEANRLWHYYDLNGEIGGFIARDRAWWYASMREQDVQIRQVNFPVKPLRTRLTNYTGKATVRLNDRHRVVAFAQPGRNSQPTRLDPFGAGGGRPIDAGTAIHETVDATSHQRTSGIVWKAEWNATIGERLFAEARIGQFDARRPSAPNGAAPRYEDIDTLLVTGGGRSYEQAVRRNQAHTSVSFLKNGMGSHHVKIGGEIFDTLSRERWFSGFPGGVLHVLRNGEPAEVYLFLTPSDSSSGIRISSAYAGDTWRVTDRVTMNLGIRFDRYRVFLPEQNHPSGGANGQAVSFPAVPDVVTWNLAAPRLGAAIDLLGDRTTILKGSIGRYWLAPGDLGPNVNPNATEWWRRYLWRDLNADGRWQPGEQGDQPRASRGGAAVESIDPAVRAPWLDEATASLERELPASVGLRTGIVWRREAGRYARQNVNRPFAAYSAAVAIPDPGPDGETGTPDDGRPITGYNVDPAQLAAPPVNIVRNVNGADSRHVTWELGAQRRLRGNWSLSAGFAHTWSAEHANAYGGQLIRQNALVLSPNDLLNADARGRHHVRTWTATLSSTIRLPKGFGVSPLIRHQSGQPFGRTLSAAMNFGVIRLLAEPVGTRRMENVTLVDVRTEKEIARSGTRRGSVFVDVFNLFNGNSAQNANWASGPGFLQPLTVVAPRIARFGVRLAF